MNKISTFVAVLMFLLVLTPTVAAIEYSPAFIVATAVSTNDDVKYIELLVKKKEIINYVEYNKASYFGPDSEIAKYEYDGYVSFSAHCSTAIFDNYFRADNLYEKGILDDDIERCYVNEFGNNDDVNMEKYYTTVKFALLNQKGEIVTITNEEKTKDNSYFTERSYFLIDGENKLTVVHDFIGYTFIPVWGFIISVCAILVIVLISFIKFIRKHRSGTIRGRFCD